MLGREDFTVRVTKKYEVFINLLEDPAGRTARKSTIETEFILCEGEVVSELIGKPKATSKLEGRDTPNMPMILL